MFQFYIRRILKSYIFWLSVIILTLILLIGSNQDMLDAGTNKLSFLYLFEWTSSLGIGQILSCILVPIPFLYFYIDEMNSKATYYQMIRCNKTSYFISQLLSALVSVIILCLISIFLYTCVCYVFGARFIPSSYDKSVESS